MEITAVVSCCVSGQLPLPRARVISVTGTRQCVVCNAGNVMCNVKWVLDPFTQVPWDQGWAAWCPLIGGVSQALASDWLIQWPHIRHPGEVRAANTCHQESALTPLLYNMTNFIVILDLSRTEPRTQSDMEVLEFPDIKGICPVYILSL